MPSEPWGRTLQAERTARVENPELECVQHIQRTARALARWLSWLEHCPIHQKVVGSIFGQGTYLDYGYSPWLGCVWEATN